MALLDDTNAAIKTWSDANIATNAIAANVPAWNQIFNSYGDLAAGIDTAIATADAASGTEAKATGTLTLTPGAIADDKVQIGGLYYQPATSVVDGAGTLVSPYIFAKGANDAAALANLRKAINASGVAGTDYSLSLVANPKATATATTSLTLSVQALQSGTAGNAVSTTVTTVSTSDGLAWGGSTLSGGVSDSGVSTAAQSAVDDWRDTLRCVPLSADDDATAQLDAAIAALKTAMATLASAL